MTRYALILMLLTGCCQHCHRWSEYRVTLHVMTPKKTMTHSISVCRYHWKQEEMDMERATSKMIDSGDRAEAEK